MKSVIKTISNTTTKVVLEVKPAFQITAAQNRESMTTTPTTTTIKKAFVKLITIDVAEGQFAVKGASKTSHPSWQSANERIKQICAKAPETGGYDMCDVVVVWEDDHSYAFRYDAARVGSASHEGMLHDRIKGGLLYSAGLKCPFYMSEERYHSNLSDPLLDGRKHQATRMLKTLHFVDVEHTPEFKEIPDMNTTTTTPIQTAMEKAREAARAHKAKKLETAA